jgi:hypothetical protein
MVNGGCPALCLHRRLNVLGKERFAFPARRPVRQLSLIKCLALEGLAWRRRDNGAGYGRPRPLRAEGILACHGSVFLDGRPINEASRERFHVAATIAVQASIAGAAGRQSSAGVDPTFRAGMRLRQAPSDPRKAVAIVSVSLRTAEDADKLRRYGMMGEQMSPSIAKPGTPLARSPTLDR